MILFIWEATFEKREQNKTSFVTSTFMEKNEKLAKKFAGRILKERGHFKMTNLRKVGERKTS